MYLYASPHLHDELIQYKSVVVGQGPYIQNPLPVGGGGSRHIYFHNQSYMYYMKCSCLPPKYSGVKRNLMLKCWKIGMKKNVRYLIIRHALVDKSLLPVVCKQFITKLFSQLNKFCEGKNTVVYWFIYIMYITLAWKTPIMHTVWQWHVMLG